MNENSSLGRVIEGFIFIFIILVIFQTFGDEFAVYMNYTLQIRKPLLIAGFCFDLIFSIELIARLVVSGKRKKAGFYMVREGGFIDLFASLPLLLLNSGPLLYMTFFSVEAGWVLSIGSLSFLKIVKVARIARILRFIRTLKIFGKMKNRYTMTPKFITSVLSITISLSVIALMGFTFVENGSVIQSRSAEMQTVLQSYMEKTGSNDFETIIGDSNTVLFVKKDDKIVYSRINQSVFQENFLNDDFFIKNIHGYDFYFNNKDKKRTYSLINMMVFSLIIAVIIAIATLYRRLFNRHIASVTTVMLRGFKTASYSTPVRIKKGKSDYEIYQLAEQYNNKWLPIKRRIIEIKRKRDF